MRKRIARKAGWLAAILVFVAVAGFGSLYALPGAWFSAWRQAMLFRSGAEHRQIEVGGERLGYVDVGPRGGEPIVLLHGLRGELTVSLPLANELADEYRVLAFELPGHGTTPPPAQPLDIGRAGDLVLEAAAQLGVERGTFVGHSMGGWVLAWQALAHPERFERLVLISSAGLSFEPPPLPLVVSKTADDLEQSLEFLFASPPPFTPRPLLRVAAERPAGTALDMLASGLSGRFLLDDYLNSMSVPTLVIFGAQDRVVPPEAGRKMAEQIPGAKYVEVGEAGHMLPMTFPRETAEAIVSATAVR